MNPESIPVFTSGEKYDYYRIPSIITAANGSLLAFAEARDSLWDQAKNEIVIKRSDDLGKTWHSFATIAEPESESKTSEKMKVKVGSLNNPCAVVDRTNGRVLLVFQMYPPGVSEFRNIKPTDIRDYMVYSDDHGITWSEMRDITQSTKKPESLTIASGPGIGIQLTRSKYKGRIIMPYNHRIGTDWHVYCSYSDDGGKTWIRSEDAPNEGKFNGGNEATVVELSDGRLMMNVRPFSFKIGTRLYRKITFSEDGGQTWSQLKKDTHLPDPQCQGAILRYSDEDNVSNWGKSIQPTETPLIVFSNAATKWSRNHGTIRISNDNGRTWPFKKVIQKKRFAYSSLCQLPNGDIGCLYETGANRLHDSIDFITIKSSEIESFKFPKKKK